MHLEDANTPDLYLEVEHDYEVSYYVLTIEETYLLLVGCSYIGSVYECLEVVVS